MAAIPAIISGPRLSAVKFAFTSAPPISLCFKVLGFFSDQCYQCQSVVCFLQMEKKIFWLLFTVLGVVMGLVLPSLWWNLALTLPLLVLCWWVVYRSGWFS